MSFFRAEQAAKLSISREKWARPDSNRGPSPRQGDVQMEGGEQSEVVKESYKNLSESEHKKQSSGSLMDVELRYTKEELDAYTEKRLTGISKKTKWWIEKASETFWEQTKGVVSFETLSKFKEFTLNNWDSRDAWSKVLNFGKSFLGELSKLRMDTRYRDLGELFLEMPKSIKERKRTTDRAITENDVKNAVRYFVNKWKTVKKGRGKLDYATALSHVTQILFGAYTGQRPETISKLRVEQFEEALKINPPTLLVEANQDKIRMEHYVPLHPDLIPFLKELLKIRKKQGRKLMFEHESCGQQLKRAMIPLEKGELIKDKNKRHFVLGDLRKFAEQMADKIKWDTSNKNYILTHNVSSVDWQHYKHPLPEFVYQIYMESWKDVHLIPKEAYELV
ncbi:conserved hypothetical protein [Archaeoglobus fulgidus DSM 4304]|uniref:Integrase SSV1 C-terminal domain-containing protein n=2 Tax=Archaeoglobaceae TaxID=2232 RepID=O30312_ARCFU|nr:conserved hypothetical protein [Archaeoglobus fulgidus DSM 4304]